MRRALSVFLEASKLLFKITSFNLMSVISFFLFLKNKKTEWTSSQTGDSTKNSMAKVTVFK